MMRLMAIPRWRRWLRIVGLAVGLIVIAAVVLVRGFGLRWEMTGGGTRPIFTFESREARFDALERQRAAQQAQAPAPAPASTPSASQAAVATSASSTPTAPAEKDAAAPGAAAPMAPSAAPAPAATIDAGWSDFRGPRRDGVYDGPTPVRLPWSADGPRLLWKQPVGEGYASFVSAGGRIFTIEQRRQREVVAAYDLDTGRELWTHAWDALFSESMGGDGPRATPVWHGGRVYALGGTGELRCLRDDDGALVWRHDILRENGAPNLQWGMSASPLLVDDKVIVLPGGSGGRSVVAYHKDTGARLWSVLDDPQAYTAPMVVTRLGVRQLVVVSAQRMMGLEIANGALLWEYPWVTDYGINASQPISVGDDRLFISAGYGHGAALVSLTRENDRWQARTVWQNNRLKTQFTSPVLHDGYVYGLDQSILACIDVATGELKWKGGRYGFGQLVLAGDHLVVLTERGELALVRATPASHQEVALVPAIEGKTWNHPAIADGRLLVRNAREMAAFDLRRSVPVSSGSR
jgi:outer membrane protein assembly factor BamB